jgi:hypothetical protein
MDPFGGPLIGASITGSSSGCSTRSSINGAGSAVLRADGRDGFGIGSADNDAAGLMCVDAGALCASSG